MDESWSTYERRLIAKAAQHRIPINGSFELLPLCNMNCKMCYVRLDRAQMLAQGRIRTSEEWLTIARQMKDAGTLFLILTGGEPLLHPQFKEIYLGLRNLGMIVTVNTNGTLIDEEWVSFFVENPPRRINITLYGSDKETYGKLCGFEQGFEKTLNGIKLLRENEIAVKINGSLVRENQRAVDEITVKAKLFDAAVNISTYMYPAKRERKMPFDMQLRLSPEEAAAARVHFLKISLGSERFCRLRDEVLHLASNTPQGEYTPGKISCQAGHTSFTVNWQGEMRPCVMLEEPSFPVFDVGFDKAWCELTKAVDALILSPKCSACRLRAVCQTCAACAFHETGSFTAVPEYMCRYMKAMLKSYAESVHVGED